jgi:hypothetical protein
LAPAFESTISLTILVIVRICQEEGKTVSRMSMFAGLSKSMNISSEPEPSGFNLGATGQKFNAAATKLANGEMPSLTEESAFAKCCPNLTFKQVA